MAYPPERVALAVSHKTQNPQTIANVALSSDRPTPAAGQTSVEGGATGPSAHGSDGRAGVARGTLG